MRRLLTAVLAVPVAAGLLLAGAALLPERSPREAAATGPVAVRPDGIGRQCASDTCVTALESHLKDQPRDGRSWSALGLVHVEQARRLGDPGHYPKAEAAFAKAAALTPDDDLMTAGRGALAAARHDFTGALRLADAALRINPYSPVAHTVRVDALVELGRYAEARTAAVAADNTQPGLPTFTRLSYLDELAGRTDSAAKLLRRGLDPALDRADTAFLRFHLGELARGTGRYAEADREYGAALAADPGYLPALAGRAKVAAAQGRIPVALADYAKVVARLPLPEYAAGYGELLDAAGRHTEAAQQYAVARAGLVAARTGGVNDALETAVFEADHGSPAVAVTAARAEWSRRQSIHVADALAWALHKAGRNAEALGYAQAATKLGTKDAKLLLHRGTILRALGRTADADRDLRAARALDPGYLLTQGGVR